MVGRCSKHPALLQPPLLPQVSHYFSVIYFVLEMLEVCVYMKTKITNCISSLKTIQLWKLGKGCNFLTGDRALSLLVIYPWFSLTVKVLIVLLLVVFCDTTVYQSSLGLSCPWMPFWSCDSWMLCPLGSWQLRAPPVIWCYLPQGPIASVTVTGSKPSQATASFCFSSELKTVTHHWMF